MSEEWEEAICPNCGAEGVSRQEGIMRCSACFAALPYDEDEDDDDDDDEDDYDDDDDEDDYDDDEDFLEED